MTREEEDRLLTALAASTIREGRAERLLPGTVRSFTRWCIDHDRISITDLAEMYRDGPRARGDFWEGDPRERLHAALDEELRVSRGKITGHAIWLVMRGRGGQVWGDLI